MQCQRGFIITRNRRSGELRPFFVKVREEDIVWKSGNAPGGTSGDDIEYGENGIFKYEHNKTRKRVRIWGRQENANLTFVSPEMSKVELTGIPVPVNHASAVVVGNQYIANATYNLNQSHMALYIKKDVGLSTTLVAEFYPFDTSVINSGNISRYKPNINFVIEASTE